MIITNFSQRQGAFGSVFFKTKLGVTAANDAELTNMDNNISEIVRSSLDAGNNLVMFEFKTPLSAGIRYTSDYFGTSIIFLWPKENHFFCVF